MHTRSTRIGEKHPLASCTQGFNQYGYIFCADVSFGSEFRFYDFRLNRINGRFLLTFPLGYYTVVPEIDKRFMRPTEENSNIPYMAIGKCSPFWQVSSPARMIFPHCTRTHD
jgi:hypothetical protein